MVSRKVSMTDKEDPTKLDRTLPLIDQVRWVSGARRASRIGGYTLEPSSADLILQAHERLSPHNQKKLEGVPVRIMQIIACEVLGIPKETPN